MKNRLHIVSIMVIYLISLSENTFAEISQNHIIIPNTAQTALKIAKQDLITRQANADKLGVTGFDKAVSDTEGNKTLLRFDPSKPENTQWKVIFVSGKLLSEALMPSPEILSPDIIEALSLEYYVQDESYWVF